MKPHQQAMLAAGWIAVRDLSGEITHWQDPHAAWHVWEDWEAQCHYEAGDCGSVPRLRVPPQREG